MQPFGDRFLLTVHGVTSDNSGLARLRARCEAALPGLACDSFFYGNVVPFRDLTEATADFIFRSVREKIELVVLKNDLRGGRRLFIVAHSFGTLAVVRALEMHIPGVEIEGLVLLGSIVPRDHLWDGLVEQGLLRVPPLAIVRPFDRVVPHGRWIGGGESGTRGFIALGAHRPFESYKNGGHTAYYPADCDDVVTAVRDGVQAVPRVGFDEWYGRLPRYKRWLL